MIQLVSNSSRALIQRAHIQWNLISRYALLLLPTAVLGLFVAQRLSPEFVRAMIGAFVLLATWHPNWLLLGAHPEQTRPERRFLFLGGAVGFLQMNIGATGPLIAPFFLNLGLSRQALVGSKAAVQTFGHVTKVIVFGVAGFAYATYLVPLALMCGSVIAGTWLGSQFLDRVNERAFLWLYKGVLSLIALRLLIWEAQAWLWPE